MRPSYAVRPATLTRSLGFFFVMLALTFLLGLAVGIGAGVALAVPTLTALVSGGLVAPAFRYLGGRSWGLPLAALLGGVVGTCMRVHFCFRFCWLSLRIPSISTLRTFSIGGRCLSRRCC